MLPPGGTSAIWPHSTFDPATAHDWQVPKDFARADPSFSVEKVRRSGQRPSVFLFLDQRMARNFCRTLLEECTCRVGQNHEQSCRSLELPPRTRLTKSFDFPMHLIRGRLKHEVRVHLCGSPNVGCQSGYVYVIRQHRRSGK